MKDDLTVVFVGFDGYSDMWDDCFNLYNEFWPDCPYKTIFVNNEKKVEYNNIEVLNAGKDAEWSKKVQTALKEVRTNYVCLLIEDFFLGKKVNSLLIKEVLNIIKLENIKYYKITNMNRVFKNRDKKYKNYKHLHQIRNNDEYGISLQGAIWEKKYLQELVGKENYNAWEFEFNRVKETNLNSKGFRLGCVYDDRNILNIKHGVIQSKYLPDTVKYFKKINKPLKVNREILSQKSYFKLKMTMFFKAIIPIRFRGKAKNIGRKIGFKFVSDKWNT